MANTDHKTVKIVAKIVANHITGQKKSSDQKKNAWRYLKIVRFTKFKSFFQKRCSFLAFIFLNV